MGTPREPLGKLIIYFPLNRAPEMTQKVAVKNQFGPRARSLFFLSLSPTHSSSSSGSGSESLMYGYSFNNTLFVIAPLDEIYALYHYMGASTFIFYICAFVRMQWRGARQRLYFYYFHPS
jgi:hypothetical protein